MDSCSFLLLATINLLVTVLGDSHIWGCITLWPSFPLKQAYLCRDLFFSLL